MRMLIASLLLAAVACADAAPSNGRVAPAENASVDQRQAMQVGAGDEPVNPAIDMPGYLAMAQEAARHRVTHRLSVAQFLRMSGERGAIVLDARSREKYDLRHIEGAVNLSFPDIDVASLERMLPDRNATILIYCNNNFRNDTQAFPRKAITASLNLSTYIALYTYGYRNIYELGPLLDAQDSPLALVGTP